MLYGFASSGFLPAWVWSSSGGHSLRTSVPTILLGAAFYLTLIRTLRYRRVRVLTRKYGDGPRTTGLQFRAGSTKSTDQVVMGRPDAKLTPEEAQEIMLRVTQLEMPGLIRISLAFALFKTYAIPTISQILLDSKQLSSAENVSKRFTDTGILISTWSGCPIVDLQRMDINAESVDPRNAIAIARVNWLHSRWPKIKNDDYIYTMSLFVLEPIRWAKTYGWRELLPIEQEAFFVFWKEIGRRMNIQDIPETLQDLHEWTENYEENAMTPAMSNYEVGEHTLNYVLSNMTAWFGVRKIMRQVSICLLEDRVRTAFMLPEPTQLMRIVTRCLMSFFAIQHRYFSLPRLRRMEYVPRKVPAEKLKEKMPRFHPAMFEKVPWYKPEPTGLGWILQEVLLKFGILGEEHVPGPKYKSEGYRLEEIGPAPLEQAGHAEVMRMAADIQGCPVTGIWAR